MALEFTTCFRIRQYELDSRGELPNGAIARLFQETAMRATTDAGYPNDWFTERQSIWVVHELTLEHLRPIRYPDEIEITTWLSDMQRVRTHREYEARNAATREIVACGRAHWAHLNVETLAPERIPDEIRERFAPNGIRTILHDEPRSYAALPLPAFAFHTHRRVQRYETDALQHVNNTVYLDWIEETLGEAAEYGRLGNPPQQRGGVGASPAPLSIRRHDIIYIRAALPGDEVEINAREIGRGHCTSAWSMEIKRGDALLVRDRITAVRVDDGGRPFRSPLLRTKMDQAGRAGMHRR